MKKIILFSIILAASAEAYSQKDKEERYLDSLKGAFTIRQESVKEKELYSPGKSKLLSNIGSIGLNSEFGDASASALIAFPTSASSTFSLYFKQPFDTKPKKVTFFDLDGLATGTSAEFAFQKIFWNPKADDNLFQKLKVQVAKQKNTPASDTSALFRGLTTGDFTEDLMDSFWKSPSNKYGNAVLFGLSYALAKNEIDYVVDSFALRPVNETKTNHNLRLTLGVYTKNRAIWSLSFVQEIKFKTGDPITMNFPLNSTGLSFTKDVTYGKYNRQDLTRIQVDYRKNFYADGKEILAIAPSLAYRTIEKSFVFELPLYFFNFKDENGKVKGLNGGITIGYANKLNEKKSFRENSAVSLFVGAPFDLFGHYKTR